MAAIEDVRGQKIARAEFARRQVDISRASLYVSHGVLYIRGDVGPMPEANFVDLNSEMNLIAKVLRQRPEIREVVCDANMTTPAVAKKPMAA